MLASDCSDYSLPVLVAIGCGAPPDVNNASLVSSNDNVYQSLAVYACNTGYVASGRIESTCLVNGSWSEIWQTCDGKINN